MDTKHINDTSDPSALEARALSDQLDSGNVAPLPQGLPLLRLVENPANDAEDNFSLAGAAAAATDEATAKNRPARVGFVIHRLGGRMVPWYRRQR